MKVFKLILLSVGVIHLMVIAYTDIPHKEIANSVKKSSFKVSFKYKLNRNQPFRKLVTKNITEKVVSIKEPVIKELEKEAIITEVKKTEQVEEDTNQIVEVEELVNKPEYEVRINPSYPRAARVRGIAGKVILEAILDKYGRVSAIKVIQAAHALLVEAAKKALMGSIFRPGMLNGAPVNVRMKIPFNFKLN